MRKITEKRRLYKLKWAKENRLKLGKLAAHRDSFNLVGKKFGRLTVISNLKEDAHSNSKCLCRCDCGKEKTVFRMTLINGNTKSCGCIKREITIQRNTIHNGCGTKEYIAWNNMKERCYNKKNNGYNYYGELGILVCERWLNSFEYFLEDMGVCPSPELSLDRINTKGNYEKDNCRWATDLVQANNKTNNHPITYNGETLNISQWARRFNVKPQRFHKNRFKGWQDEKIVEFFYNQTKLVAV